MAFPAEDPAASAVRTLPELAPAEGAAHLCRLLAVVAGALLPARERFAVPLAEKVRTAAKSKNCWRASFVGQEPAGQPGNLDAIPIRRR